MLPRQVGAGSAPFTPSRRTRSRRPAAELAMATGRGRALRLYGSRVAPAADVAAPPGAAEVGPFTPAAVAAGPR